MDRELIAFIAIGIVWAVFFGFVIKGRLNKARRAKKG